MKIGDRVIGNCPIQRGYGIRGTVIDLDTGATTVEFDVFINGHDGFGFTTNEYRRGKDGYCWCFFSEDDLKIDEVYTVKEILKNYE
jgi:hypothetical protein